MNVRQPVYTPKIQEKYICFRPNNRIRPIVGLLLPFADL